MVRSLLPALFLAATAASCVDNPHGEPAEVFPAAIELIAPDGEGSRHHYEITGPTWQSPHRYVGDVVFATPARPQLHPDGTFEAAFSDPAPYTRNSRVRVRASIGAALAPSLIDGADWHIRGVLRSTTDETIEPLEILDAEGDGLLVDVTTKPLPSRVDLWELELTWALTVTADGVAKSTDGRTTHLIPTTFRDPREHAPRYRETFLWGAEFAAGEWDEDDPEAKYRVAEALTRGIRKLGDRGRSYGGFPRPPYDKTDNRAHVFIDFQRTACGEYRALLLALIELHGIDAKWSWFNFPEPDSKHWVKGQNTHYRTRIISAVGREAKPWMNTNHSVVRVDGRVYDPTYTVIKDSLEEYEDWMFVEYCRKRVDGYECQPNPKGWSFDGNLEPRVLHKQTFR